MDPLESTEDLNGSRVPKKKGQQPEAIGNKVAVKLLGLKETRLVGQRIFCGR